MKYVRTITVEIPELEYFINELEWGVTNITELKTALDQLDDYELLNDFAIYDYDEKGKIIED